MRDARLVILDEPTAALGVSQTEQVLQLIRRLAERGIAVLVVSHNLTDVFAVADRIGVLRLGRLVSSGPIGHYDAQRPVELITTGRLSSDDAPAAVPTGASAGAAAGGAAPTGDDRRPPAGPDRSDPDAGGG
jgi:ABC-type sugar transport system ATPase subunit